MEYQLLVKIAPDASVSVVKSAMIGTRAVSEFLLADGTKIVGMVQDDWPVEPGLDDVSIRLFSRVAGQFFGKPVTVAVAEIREWQVL